MDLELSAEESELRDNVRSVLASVCPPAAVRAVFEGKGDPASIWDRMVELYWPALAIAEDHGGLGMGFVEVALVAEELGVSIQSV
jgi:acyl-CoA dehydrogenase